MTYSTEMALVSFRIETDTVDELRVLAAQAERSLSAEIRLAIRHYLSREVEK